MGYLPVPTPAMSGWSIEVRSASVRVRPPEDAICVSSDGVWDVPVSEVPRLLAAVEQAARCAVLGAEFAWARRVGDRWSPVDEIPRPDTVTLDGPVTAGEFADFVRSAMSVSAEVVSAVARVLDAAAPTLPVEVAAAVAAAAAGTGLSGRMAAALQAADAGWVQAASEMLGESGGV